MAAAPDAWAALRSARMRYQVSYELGVTRRRKLILADLMDDRRAAAEVRSFNMRDFLLRSYDVLASYERAVRLRLARRQSLVRLAGDAASGAGMGLVYLALACCWHWLDRAAPGGHGDAEHPAGRVVTVRLLLLVNQCYESGLYFNDYLDLLPPGGAAAAHAAGSLPAPEGSRSSGPRGSVSATRAWTCRAHRRVRRDPPRRGDRPSR